MSDRPELTLTEAAKAAAVSRKTIRRRLDADEFPNARRLSSGAGPAAGPWVIPVADLLAAGFQLHQQDTPDPEPIQTEQPEPELAAEVTRLEAELETERTRRATAEALREAADQLRASAERNADDLRTALRMLEAGPQPAPAPPSLHWWNRKAHREAAEAELLARIKRIDQDAKAELTADLPDMVDP